MRSTPSARRRVLAVMAVGYFLVLLDVTIVNVALPHMSADLGADVASLQWVVDGYALALASLMLAAGTIGDLHGHKRVVLGGLVVFGVASLGCGLAPTVTALVAFRVLQGAGAAVMLPGSLAVIAETFPSGREQARAIGAWAAIGSAALPAGPLLGGALTDWIGWRAIFLVNVPLVAVGVLIAHRVVPPTRRRVDRQLDVRGVVLGAGALAALVFACIHAGQTHVDAACVTAGLAAVVLMVAFVLTERSARDPIVPPSLLKRPVFLTANAVAGAMNFATLGLLFVLTLYLQEVRHLSPLSAGVALLPLFLPLSVLAPVGGRLAARFGARLPMSVGLVVAAAGIALLANVDAHSGYAALIPALLLWGIGLGLLTPAVVGAAVAAVPGDRAGLASAVNNTARQAAGAIGIAAFGAIAGAAAGGEFLPGLHAEALAAAALFVVAAVASVVLIRPPAEETQRRSIARRAPSPMSTHPVRR